MKHLVCIALVLCSCLSLNAQDQTKAYSVFFTAKSNTALLQSPEQFLSQRALERRQKQSISVHPSDLPVSQHRIAAISSRVTSTGPVSKWLNAMYVEATSEQVLDLLELPFIQSVSRVAGSTVTHTSIALPPKNYGYTEDQLEQINLIKGPHRKGLYGRSKLIAVLDAGFAGANTVSFSDEFNLVATKNFVTGGTDVYSGNGSHGFSVLSCMAGNVDGVYVGSAPEASYALITTEDIWSETPQEMYNWIAGAEFADSIGADIINSSLGYYEFDDPTDSYTTADLDGRTSIITLGALAAARKGMLVVTSAGNAGGGAWNKLTFPADADSVLTVGAVNPYGIAADFTSRGYTTDGRVKPNVSARGARALVYRSDGTIAEANGTSFSSPIMAGAAASLWDAIPDATAQQIIKALEVSSSHYYGHNEKIGYGIPNLAFAERYLATLVRGSVPEVVIYPNPFPDYIELFLPDSELLDIHLELRDLNQRTVTEAVLKNKRYQTIWAPGDHIPAGTYFLFIQRGDYSDVKRIIKLQ